jgi:hypothetical protein
MPIMQAKPLAIIGYIICFIGTGVTFWISLINLDEIVNRANGRYTLFSQSAFLTDGEAVIYFSFWTLLFIFICYLSIKRLLKRKYIWSIVYALIVLLAILLSTYVDTLFYHQLV